MVEHPVYRERTGEWSMVVDGQPVRRRRTECTARTQPDHRARRGGYRGGAAVRRERGSEPPLGRGAGPRQWRRGGRAGGRGTMGLQRSSCRRHDRLRSAAPPAPQESSKALATQCARPVPDGCPRHEEPRAMSTVLTYYLLGWVMTATRSLLAVGKLNDRLAPAPRP